MHKLIWDFGFLVWAASISLMFICARAFALITDHSSPNHEHMPLENLEERSTIEESPSLQMIIKD